MPEVRDAELCSIDAVVVPLVVVSLVVMPPGLASTSATPRAAVRPSQPAA